MQSNTPACLFCSVFLRAVYCSRTPITQASVTMEAPPRALAPIPSTGSQAAEPALDPAGQPGCAVVMSDRVITLLLRHGERKPKQVTGSNIITTSWAAIPTRTCLAMRVNYKRSTTSRSIHVEDMAVNLGLRLVAVLFHHAEDFSSTPSSRSLFGGHRRNSENRGQRFQSTIAGAFQPLWPFKLQRILGQSASWESADLVSFGT